MADEVRYYRVSPRIWTACRHWSPDARTLALYILTCPHRTVEGLYWLPKGYMTGDLEWSPQRLAPAMAELVEDGFVEYDDDAQVVLIVKALKYQAPANPNGVKAALRQLQMVPESPLDLRFRQQAEQYCERLAERLPQRFTLTNGLTSNSSSSSKPPARARAREDSPPVDNSASGGTATPKPQPPTPARRVLDRIVGETPPDIGPKLRSGITSDHEKLVADALKRGWKPHQLVTALAGGWHGVNNPPAALLHRLRRIGPAPPGSNQQSDHHSPETDDYDPGDPEKVAAALNEIEAMGLRRRKPV